MTDDPQHADARTAEHWRQLAERALQDAQFATDAQLKRVLVNIANQYLTLAQKAEERERN